MHRASPPSLASVFAALALAACAARVHACSAKTSPSDQPLPCAVDDVLQRNCRTCHASPPQFSAPMSLLTFDDVHAPAHSDPSKQVYEMMGIRIHDDAKPMPQPPNPRLSAADMATLDAWIAAGAPAGTGSCTAPGVDGGVASDAGDASTSADAPPQPDVYIPSTCPDLHVQPPTPWQMPQTTDDQYVCYGFDVTPTAKRHAIRITPRLDNTRILHHMILFQADSTYSSTPTPCDFTTSVQWRMVYGWAPGAQTLDLPPEA
jgi:hypothetical protein